VGTGSDYTLFSTVDGIVIYSKKPDRNFVSAGCDLRPECARAATDGAPRPASLRRARACCTAGAWRRSAHACPCPTVTRAHRAHATRTPRAPPPTRRQVHVYPLEHAKAQAAVKASHTTAPANGVSRKERRRAAHTPRAAQREAAAAAVAAVAARASP
jgi:hypothetical protein